MPHYYYSKDGWGMGTELLCDLDEQGVIRIKLLIDKAFYLVSDMEDWIEFGQDIHHKGFEKQKILVQKKMVKEELK